MTSSDLDIQIFEKFTPKASTWYNINFKLSTFNVIQNFIRSDDSQPNPGRPDDLEPDPGARSPKIGLARSGSGRPGQKFGIMPTSDLEHGRTLKKKHFKALNDVYR